jgi:ribosome-associated translation inhibitor RaiA
MVFGANANRVDVNMNVKDSRLIQDHCQKHSIAESVKKKSGKLARKLRKESVRLEGCAPNAQAQKKCGTKSGVSDMKK